MIEVARDIVKYIGFLIKARRQAGEVAELEAWHQFVLAAIQTKTGGRSDIEVEVPYSYVRDYARSYGAPYTSCQKVKEAFDALVSLGYISRVKAGSGSSAPIKYRQYVFHVDPDSILMGSGGSGGSGGSRTSEQEDAVIWILWNPPSLPPYDKKSEEMMSLVEDPHYWEATPGLRLLEFEPRTVLHYMGTIMTLSSSGDVVTFQSGGSFYDKGSHRFTLKTTPGYGTDKHATGNNTLIPEALRRMRAQVLTRVYNELKRLMARSAAGASSSSRGGLHLRYEGDRYEDLSRLPLAFASFMAKEPSSRYGARRVSGSPGGGGGLARIVIALKPETVLIRVAPPSPPPQPSGHMIEVEKPSFREAVITAVLEMQEMQLI